MMFEIYGWVGLTTPHCKNNSHVTQSPDLGRIFLTRPEQRKKNVAHIKLIKLRTIRVGHVVCIEETRRTYEILAGKPQETMWETGLVSRIILKWGLKE
jgi:hypothetical protein